MYKKIKGSPFILSSFSVQESLYLKDFKFSRATSNIKYGSGFALRMTTKSLIKASLGEHLERLAAAKNYEKTFEDQANPMRAGFNLVTGEKVDIPAERLFLNLELPMFKAMQNKEDLFNDSCGLASHIQSIDAIKSGFNEFIERQSLIYSWLSESQGETINLVDIYEIENNNSLKKIFRIAQCYSDEILAFEISIIKGIYVVLTIGYKGAAFASGLGTDSNILKALEKSLNEYLMILDSCLSIKAYPQQSKTKYDNVYASNFYKMNVKEFWGKFDYLVQSSNYIDIKSSTYNIDNFQDLIKKTHEKFQIDIYSCYLPFPLKSIDVKVVKVFSPDAYPHIWTKIFDPLDYKITESLPYTTFPNRFQAIPFA